MSFLLKLFGLKTEEEKIQSHLNKSLDNTKDQLFDAALWIMNLYHHNDTDLSESKISNFVFNANHWNKELAKAIKFYQAHHNKISVEHQDEFHQQLLIHICQLQKAIEEFQPKASQFLILFASKHHRIKKTRLEDPSYVRARNHFMQASENIRKTVDTFRELVEYDANLTKESGKQTVENKKAFLYEI